MALEKGSALALDGSPVRILGIVDDLSSLIECLLLDRNVLDFSYFFLYGHDLDFLLGDDFLVILSDFLHCIIILFDDFTRHAFDDFAFCVIDYFSSFGHSLRDRPSLIVDHFLLIGYVLNPALTYRINHKLPFTTAPCSTLDPVSLLTSSVVNLLCL